MNIPQKAVECMAGRPVVPCELCDDHMDHADDETQCHHGYKVGRDGNPIPYTEKSK